MENVNRDKLVGDLKVVLADAEDLLRAAATATGERAAELREKAQTMSRTQSLPIARQQHAIPMTLCMTVHGAPSESQPALVSCLACWSTGASRGDR
jgi:ElaB/YqjD/DUF883 family membrane-anchored ribosome-binding protein